MTLLRRNKGTLGLSFRVFGSLGILFVVMLVVNHNSSLFACETLTVTSQDYPRSLESLAGTLQEQLTAGSRSTQLLVQLAEVYLDMGDDLFVEDVERLRAYQKGADMAEQALQMDPQSAHSHFLYAANLGHIAQLEGIVASVLSIGDILAHAKRAVGLDSNHAGALHMLGMMYDGLPWVMGGDQQKALHYVERAVKADGNYTHARLNLAKLYLKREDYVAARCELIEILNTQMPRGPFAWSRYHVPEARELLRSDPLKERAGGVEQCRHEP